MQYDRICYNCFQKRDSLDGPCPHCGFDLVENAKPSIVITHAPGHMFITDILNTELNDYLEQKKQQG